jgi:uncharacterized repeat protein (TIGR01451 family)
MKLKYYTMKNRKLSTKLLFAMLLTAFYSFISNHAEAQTCNAGFTYNTTSNGVVYFFNASTSVDSITMFYWDFGNGQVATSPNPIATFASVGVYNVCLIVGTYNQSCYDTICQQVAVTNVNCNIYSYILSDSLAGTMTADAFGGTGPYTYSWNTGETTQVIYPTTIGSYSVTVTDALGCSYTAYYYWSGMACNISYTYNSPTQGTVNFYTAGTNGMPVTWNFGDGTMPITTAATFFTHTYTQSGNYQVCISMPNCMSYCNWISVNVPLPCSGVSTNIIPLQSNTYLMAEVFNANFPVSYQWTSGDTGQTIPTNGVSTFCVTITDAIGCTATDCITVNPFCNLTVAIANDSLAGTMTANATNGAAPFTYLWSNGSTQPVINPTTVGSYCVTVTDALGCSATTCSFWYGLNCNYGFTYTYQGPGEIVFITYGTNGQMVTWDFGDGTAPLVSSATQLMHPYSAAGYYIVSMSIAGCSPVYMTVYANVVGSSVVCGNVFYDNNYNSVIDTGDSGIDSAYVYIWGSGTNQTAFTDASGNYTFNNLPAGNYNIQFCIWNLPSSQGANITVPADTGSCAIYSITIGANDTICGNNFGVYNNSSEISGTVFLDANNNGVMDGSETGLSYQVVQIGSNYTYTDWYGNYSIWLIPGNYTVSFTPSGSYASGTITTPTSYQILVSAPGNSYSNNNFGIYMPPGMNDLSVVITPHTTVTPGFPAWYDINVCNYGATATGATVTMIYDAALTTNYQSPAGSVNSSTHTITWTIPNINPNTCVNIWTSFNALTSIQLGSSTLEFVMVTPTSGIDNFMANNTDTVHQTVIGSWDPNNKIVVKTNNIADPSTQYVSSVNADQEIVYTINFQNTGNAPAVNVVVIDEMSSNLDVNSYQFINASHNCEVNRIGNTVTYRFMNIMLPDSVNNEPQSHGFVNFKVNALNGLPMGTLIVDFANIYFDFNDPVQTNDAVITLIDVTSLATQNATNASIYPNPAKESFNVVFNSGEAGIANLVMFDNTGRKVLSSQTQVNVGQNKTSINTNSLDNGLYFIELIQGNGTILKNVVSIQK